ncbi:BET3 family protein [Magnaporthiopsis poae ATCC 64411]|uniref:BET3 family protein n=1 Tax=Magnaporthiopsis poae (strain ATCC 64411 / 73-15) TaxID=644358 RepID=A0A0C4E395_MAGP6|nr:BET3 family protein [Magnaporthiopsis poae ATCC 64411]
MSFETVMPPYNASDPNAMFFSSSCLDFLLIELVPMAYRVANEVDAAAAAAAATATAQASSSATTTTTTAPAAATAAGAAGAPSTESRPGTGTGGGRAGARRGTMDEDEERDAVSYRLEMQGYRVGQGLVERFSKDRPRFNDTLDVIKFLCKDLWTLVFRKQVDNLKTNHRGVYVLTDNSFRPFARMSAEAGGQAVLRAEPFLWFPCGIVRGALAAMGITATVHAETTELPGAVFQIKTVSAKA